MTSWKTMAAILVGVGVGVCPCLLGHAHESRPKASSAPMELTALDYFQIQQLVAKYAQYIDTCSNNGYDYADLFSEDGFFAPFQNGQLGHKAQGREALARVSGGGPDGCTGAGWIGQGVHHIYVNHIIDPTPEGAKGQVNMPDDWTRRRQEQDRARRLLRGYVREDAGRMEIQVAHPPRDV